MDESVLRGESGDEERAERALLSGDCEAGWQSKKAKDLNLAERLEKWTRG